MRGVVSGLVGCFVVVLIVLVVATLQGGLQSSRVSSVCCSS